jgi:ribonuclease T1
MAARLAWLVLLVLFAAAACARGDQFLPQVELAELPPEAARTLELIKRGGPFPYRKDGAVFRNRERRLPAREQGYYREYTVPTKGAQDRGARRIVAGRGAEYYYTDDHYESFRRIRD